MKLGDLPGWLYVSLMNLFNLKKAEKAIYLYNKMWEITLVWHHNNDVIDCFLRHDVLHPPCRINRLSQWLASQKHEQLLAIERFYTRLYQTASTNWTGQSKLFCSGWELDNTDLMPQCTTNSRLASLRCAHATQTSWLQNISCSIVHYMMLWGGTHGQNRHFWGTSSMATWRSWGGQLPSWGQQASPSSVQRRRKTHACVQLACQKL